MFEKNDELIKLDINEVNFDNCAEMFNNTNCSIIYITKNEKMYGIVSRGDIIRTIRKSKDLNNIINTNNKYILYSVHSSAISYNEQKDGNYV